MAKKKARPKNGKRKDVIFRPYITLKNGKILWAKSLGFKAFPIPVDDDQDRNDAPKK